MCIFMNSFLLASDALLYPDPEIIHPMFLQAGSRSDRSECEHASWYPHGTGSVWSFGSS
jgi:hypothetical protein